MDSGFQEAAAYPTPRRTFHFAFADSVRTLPQQTRARAAQYVVINEVSSLVGEIGMTVSFTGSAAGAALMVVYQNGEYDVWQQTASGEASGGGGLRITTTARWEEARQVRLIFANPTDADQDITYSFGSPAAARTAYRAAKLSESVHTPPPPFRSRCPNRAS